MLSHKRETFSNFEYGHKWKLEQKYETLTTMIQEHEIGK